MAKVRMVGTMDAEVVKELEGAPCIVLTADSLDELRYIGGMIGQAVTVMKPLEFTPSNTAGCAAPMGLGGGTFATTVFTSAQPSGVLPPNSVESEVPK